MAKLNRRERIVVIGGVLLLFLLLAGTVGRNYWDTYQQSEVNLRNAQERLEAVKLWRQEIEAERVEQEAVEDRVRARGQRFNLYTFASNSLREHGLEERARIENKRSLASASDKLSEIEVTLNGVTMEELVNWLHEVYASRNLIVMRELDELTISRRGNGLDVRMSLLAPTGA